MSPPAKVDGFIQFVNDVPDHFGLDEQRAISTSDAGKVLAMALVRCDSHARQFKDARAKLQALAASEATDNESLELRRDVFLAKAKYVDCLTCIACPELWKQYKRCWEGTVGRLSPAELERVREEGKLELLCLAERRSLERGVGDLVSSAVVAGDIGSSCGYDLFSSEQ